MGYAKNTWKGYGLLAVVLLVAVIVGGMGISRRDVEQHHNKLLSAVTENGMCSRPSPSSPFRCTGFLAKSTTNGVEYASLVSFTNRPIGAVFNMQRQTGPLDTSFDDCLSGKSACQMILKNDPRFAEIGNQCAFAFSAQFGRFPPQKRIQLQKLICGL